MHITNARTTMLKILKEIAPLNSLRERIISYNAGIRVDVFLARPRGRLYQIN